MFLSCGVGEDSRESLGLKRDQILKEISPEYSLEGLLLKLQYFGHLMWRTDSLKKTLMPGRLKAGGEGADRGWDGRMTSPAQWTWVRVSSGSWWWAGKPGVLESMESKQSEMTEWLNWTDWGHLHFWPTGYKLEGLPWPFQIWSFARMTLRKVLCFWLQFMIRR